MSEARQPRARAKTSRSKGEEKSPTAADGSEKKGGSTSTEGAPRKAAKKTGPRKKSAAAKATPRKATAARRERKSSGSEKVADVQAEARGTSDASARIEDANRATTAPSARAKRVNGEDRSPLADARGQWVRALDVAKLRRPDGRAYLSKTASEVVGAAAKYATKSSRNRIPYVDGVAFLTALIDVGENGPQGGSDWKTATSAFSRIVLEKSGSAPWSANEAAGSVYLDAGPDVALPPELVDVLLDAEDLVRRTCAHQHRVDARHLLAAFLRSSSGRGAFTQLRVAQPGTDVQGPLAVAGSAFMKAIVPALAKHVLDQATDAENKEAWSAIFEELSELEIPTASRVDIVVHPSYDTDTAKPFLDSNQRLIDDPLGVVHDARAMASLVCLEEAEPPLAIGLFGDWGAGKSTFMEILEHAIEETTVRAKNARDQGEKLPFVERVAHIRFNAWHYMDTELWASIATHVFRSLHEISAEKQTDWLDEAKLERLIKRLEGTREAESEAQRRIDVLGEGIGTTAKTLAEIEKKREDIEASRVRSHVKDVLVEVALPDEGGRVHEAFRELGIGEHALDARRLDRTVRQGQTLSGRVGLLLTSLTGAPARGVRYVIGGLAAFFGVMLGMVALAAWLQDLVPVVAHVAGQLATVAGVVSGAAAWVVPSVRHVNRNLAPLLDAHDTVMREREQRERELAVEDERARRRLQQLQEEKMRAEAELAAKASEKERLESLARGERPDELLSRFIEDRAEAEDYRKHLGLIARVRQDFQTMSNIMAQQPRPGGDVEGDANLPAIDRIVLYIDDLDRCRDEQVIKVLEAVHLLLAFPLFVVVVGVDARWLEGALRRFYAAQLGEDGQASALDYLEKIFQIPFWLRSLEPNRGGTYQRLVDTLVRSNVEAGAAPACEADAEPRGDSKSRPDDAEHGSDSKNGVPELTVLDVVPREEQWEETLQRVTLTQPEVELIHALGPVAGKSPRAVKRFINLYRLIRARKSGADLDAYLGKNGEPPLYPAMLLALAMETGLQAWESQFVEGLVEHMSIPRDTEELRDLLSTLGTSELLHTRHGIEDEALKRWLIRTACIPNPAEAASAVGEAPDVLRLRPGVAQLCRRLDEQLDALSDLIGPTYPMTLCLKGLLLEGDLSRYVFRR